MRWPWQERRERAEEKAREAEAKLRRSKVEHQIARKVADRSRQLQELNGWTSTVKMIFGGHS